MDDPSRDDSLALVPIWMTKRGAGGAMRKESDPASSWYDEHSWIWLPTEVQAQLRRQAELYPSRPLRGHPCEIRLLSISPGQWDDEIRCRLFVTTLRDCPEYEALSYTWGSSSERRTITLEDLHDFSVTNTAFSALRRFRYIDKPRLIWIDAICISQGSITERQQQVSIMGEIYKNAARCLVWLGESNRSSTEVTEHDAVNHRPRDGVDDGKILEALDFVYWHAKPLWWERAWIIQEIALSREVVVCFASFQFPWGDFCWDLLRVTNYERTRRRGHDNYPNQLGSSNEHPVRQSMSERFSKLATIRYYTQDHSTHWSLAEVFQYTRSAGCSDYRDKVYCVLSMIDPREAALVPPAYDIPWAEVYAKATFAAIAVQQNLQIMLHREEDEDGMKVPTWAVNLARSGSEIPSVSTIGPDNWSEWRIGDKDQFEVDLSPNAALMKIRGYALDSIAQKKRLSNSDGDGYRLPVSAEVSAILVAAATDESVRRSYNRVVGRQDSPADRSPISVRMDNPTAQTRVQTLRDRKWPVTGFSLKVTEAFQEACILWNAAAGVPDEFDRRNAIYDRYRLDFAAFWRYAQAVAGDPFLFTTEAGFIGIASMQIKAGDVVALLHGSRFAAMLRRHGDSYLFRGFAYVHGIMYDELKVLGWSEHLVRREFLLC